MHSPLVCLSPLKRGTKWKTLDGVELVIVAAVDDRDDPHRVEVYLFDAGEVRKRFDAAYAARIKAGQIVKDNFGMWINLDLDNRRSAASVGAGLATEHKPLATFAIEELLEADAGQNLVGDTVPDTDASAEPRSIAEVIDWARHRIADLSGVRVESIKLDLKVEFGPTY